MKPDLIDVHQSDDHPNEIKHVGRLVAGQIELLQTEESIVPHEIRTARVLGKGRAAEARLVDVTTGDGSVLTCVEKVFCPGLLTRSIYRTFFQASFAYQSNSHAILASFYRRRVAWAITRAFAPEVGVACPLYVRWDRKTRAFVLASEFVEGRGIVPQKLDAWWLRRSLAKRLNRTFPRIARWNSKFYDWLTEKIPESPPQEIDELLRVMQKLETLFLESGLVGTGWQVCKRAVVSTANLLRTNKGYVSVDLESGIPSVLVLTYLKEGLRLGSFPLFDCLDPGRLTSWISENHRRLSESLSEAQFARLLADVELLIHHSQAWKASEPAIMRSPSRLLSKSFHDRYQQRIIDHWRRCEIADDDKVLELGRSSRSILSRLIYWLGWIPGRAGEFLQACAGNARVRQKVGLFVQNERYRRRVRQSAVADLKTKLKGSKRVPIDQLERQSLSRLMFHWGLSKVTPAMLHRMLSDAGYRKNWMIRLGLLITSSRFQRDYGRWIVHRRFQAWQDEGRITNGELELLRREMDQAVVQEYMRGFGVHLGLKLLLPVLLPLKVFGLGALLASGNPIYFLLLFFLLPILRTATTVWRMFGSRRPAREFREALIVGALPSVGSIAYPVQMYAACPELSTFLMRDFASRIGRIVPVYGGKDSRTELAVIKTVNVVAESLELWLSLTGSRRSVRVQDLEVAPSGAQTATASIPGGARQTVVEPCLSVNPHNLATTANTQTSTPRSKAA